MYMKELFERSSPGETCPYFTNWNFHCVAWGNPYISHGDNRHLSNASTRKD